MQDLEKEPDVNAGVGDWMCVNLFTWPPPPLCNCGLFPLYIFHYSKYHDFKKPDHPRFWSTDKLYVPIHLYCPKKEVGESGSVSGNTILNWGLPSKPGLQQ